jgi:hypothetical protein
MLTTPLARRKRAESQRRNKGGRKRRDKSRRIAAKISNALSTLPVKTKKPFIRRSPEQKSKKCKGT